MWIASSPQTQGPVQAAGGGVTVRWDLSDLQDNVLCDLRGGEQGAGVALAPWQGALSSGEPRGQCREGTVLTELGAGALSGGGGGLAWSS